MVIPIATAFYDIQLDTLSSAEISKGSRLYKNIPHSTTNVCEYRVCPQCKVHLCSKEKKLYNAFTYTWPGFVWSMLSSRQVMVAYGAEVWRFIPKQWRPWWIHCIRNKFPQVYGNISLEDPQPIFTDVTQIQRDFEAGTNAHNPAKAAFAQLRDTCNKFLIPIVSCPYGCSEYLHKCNQLPMDILYQFYLPRVNLVISNDAKQKVWKANGM